MDLTTKEYIVTEDNIEVVEKPSTDIVRDELDEESKLVDAIVNKWNELVTITENKTIKFSLIVHSLLKDYPDENYIQCCYCNYHIPRFKIENLLQTKK